MNSTMRCWISLQLPSQRSHFILLSLQVSCYIFYTDTGPRSKTPPPHVGRATPCLLPDPLPLAAGQLDCCVDRLSRLASSLRTCRASRVCRRSGFVEPSDGGLVGIDTRGGFGRGGGTGLTLNPAVVQQSGAAEGIGLSRCGKHGRRGAVV